MKPRRVIDQALCDRAERLARVHPLGDVAAILGLHPSQISRIRKRGWRAVPLGRLVRRRPGDLSIQQADMTFAELTEHYQCGNSTMLKWLSETPGRRASWRGRNLRGHS